MYRLANTLLSVCAPFLCASRFVNRRFFLIFLLLFVSVLLFVIFIILSIGFYTLFHAHTVFFLQFHIAASTYVGFVVAIVQYLPSQSVRQFLIYTCCDHGVCEHYHIPL